MPRNPPPAKYQFKKGQIANPLGSRAHKRGRISQKLKKLTAEEIEEIGAIILRGDIRLLERIKENKDETVLRVWIASIALKGISTADPAPMESLLNRFIGKPTATPPPSEDTPEDPGVRRLRIAEKLEKLGLLSVG